MDFLRCYVRIAAWLLVGLGIGLLLALQFNWFDEAPSSAAPRIADTAAVKLKGPKAIFSSETFAVDTSKTYRLGADIRVLPKSDGAPQESMIYFGVQTFDADMHELTSGPGTYRYAGAMGLKLSSSQGWVGIEGLITGEGDENHHQFRPMTRFVKLVLLPNYRLPDDTTVMIRNVEFSQRLSLAP